LCTCRNTPIHDIAGKSSVQSLFSSSICGNILRHDCWRHNEEVKEEFILKVVGGGSMHTIRGKKKAHGALA
jgi:hypothetical protein